MHIIVSYVINGWKTNVQIQNVHIVRTVQKNQVKWKIIMAKVAKTKKVKKQNQGKNPTATC